MKFGKYFCGNEISEYGRKHGFVDYGTLAKAFDAVLNNNIINVEIGYWEQTSGFINNQEQIEELENEMEYTPDIFQYYIVDDAGAHLLEDYDEIVFYNDELDMYLWGVTHYGTAWNYVLTNIPCEKEND